MRVPQCDVLIVGTGPAGCAAAITARRLGLEVIALDRATFPRDKCCGDGLTTLALRELDSLGLTPSASSWLTVNDAYIRSPSGRELHLQLPRNRGQYAAIVKRVELDAELVDLTRDEGADVREGCSFTAIELTAQGVQVSLNNGESILARNVIAADGMWSPVRKALECGPAGYRGDWHGFRQYVKADGPQSRNLWVWFEEDLLPGYAWSFPLADDQVNLGFGVVRGSRLSGKKLASIWAGLLDRPAIRQTLGNATPQDSHTAWPIPAQLPRAQLAKGPVLFVGDAATATDPLTGEGIGQALETGRLAAEAVAREATPELAAVSYEVSARAALQLDHRLAKRLSSVLARPRLAELALLAVDTNDWTRRQFARWMFEDYPRASLFDPRRWQRGLFNRDGAWAESN